MNTEPVDMIINNNKLITTINADDFGLNSSVNKAIIESFEKGLINSTTLMANMPGFDEAIELAYKHGINKQIGVHLNLTEGIPLTEQIKSLQHLFNITENTSSLRLKKFFYIDNYTKNLIFKEYSAQIQKIKTKGISITHLDTHHQLHDMWSICNILVDLLKTFNIPSMRILNNLEKSEYHYKNTYRYLMNNYLKARKVNFSDYLGDQNDYFSKLSKNPVFSKGKKVEIMVHPNYGVNNKLVDKIRGKEFEPYILF